MEAHLEKGRLIIDNENDFLREIINSVAASIHIVKLNEDGNTLPIWMNEQYSKILGYSFDDRQKIGIDYEKDTLYHPEDIDIVRNGIKELIEGKADIYAGMFRVKCKDGNWKWILSSARLFPINRESNYLLSVLIDLSEKMPEYNFLVEKYTKEIASLKNELVLKNLTKTEKEIITLLTRGLTTREIARQRIRSYETINNHKRNIFKKLRINKISELVSFAIESGLN